MNADLMAALDTLAGIGAAYWALVACVFARVGPAFAFLPVFGERVIPARIRLVAGLCLSMVIAPALVPVITPPPADALAIARYLVPETLVGLSVALSLRLFIMALQMAGTMAAQATSLAQFFGGAGVDPQPAMSQVLVMAALALLVAMGLPERCAALFILSYDMVPAGQFPSPSDIAAWGTARVGHAFALAFGLAAPFLIAATLYNLALGAINRAMPQLMVAFVGAPALTLGSLFLFLLAAPLMLGVWSQSVWPALVEPLAQP